LRDPAGRYFDLNASVSNGRSSAAASSTASLSAAVIASTFVCPPLPSPVSTLLTLGYRLGRLAGTRRGSGHPRCIYRSVHAAAFIEPKSAAEQAKAI
ncbi:MAG TPA: hypothetical protein VFO40_28180, partial [Chthoniobacterales bacterium]|nr:hypothetical protein [Chthoniobacterales bacterium]